MFLAAPTTTQPTDDANQTGKQVNDEKESKIIINAVIGGCVVPIVIIIISEYPLISGIHLGGGEAGTSSLKSLSNVTFQNIITYDSIIYCIVRFSTFFFYFLD